MRRLSMVVFPPAFAPSSHLRRDELAVKVCVNRSLVHEGLVCEEFTVGRAILWYTVGRVFIALAQL